MSHLKFTMEELKKPLAETISVFLEKTAPRGDAYQASSGGICGGKDTSCVAMPKKIGNLHEL